MAAARAIDPEVMIEFRQPYIGPLMRKYGNMFRAGDAPNAYVANRVRTIDLRLLSGETAVHSDMIMWHPDEPVERAALQLLNVMFSVPQVSVRLGEIPRPHLDMVTFYTGYWSENRGEGRVITEAKRTEVFERVGGRWRLSVGHAEVTGQGNQRGDSI